MFTRTPKEVVVISFGATYIRAAVFTEGKTGIETAVYAETPLAHNLLERGDKKEFIREALHSCLVKIGKETPRNVKTAVVLPEEFVYTHFFSVPREGEHINERIVTDIHRTIPLPEDDTVFAYLLSSQEKVQDSPSRSAAGTAYAISRKDLVSLNAVVEEQGLQVDFFDVPSRALARALFRDGRAASPVLLLRLEQEAAGIYMYDSEGLRYSYWFAAQDRALSEKKIDTAASDYEKTVLRELDTALGYYHGRSDNRIQSVVLVGREKRALDLLHIIEERFGVKVWVAANEYLRNIDASLVELLGAALYRLRPARHDVVFQGIKQKETKRVALRMGDIKNVLHRTGFKTYMGILLVCIALALVAYSFIQYFNRNAAELVYTLPPGERTGVFEEEEADGDVSQEPRGEAAESSAASRNIVVKETPTGWLNVRGAPHTEAGVLTRIYPGEGYPYVREEGDWVQVELPEGPGWVYGVYVEVSP